jgi:hypothetical protein
MHLTLSKTRLTSPTRGPAPLRSAGANADLQTFPLNYALGASAFDADVQEHQTRSSLSTESAIARSKKRKKELP